MSFVSHGCEHVQALFKERKREAMSQYTLIIHAIHEKHPLAFYAGKNIKQPDGKPLISLGPTYLCLQCPNVSSTAMRDKHWDAKGHAFSVDSKTGCLYCQTCGDFIYDPVLEDVRLRKGGKKRKLSEIVSEDEARRVSVNTNVAPCAALGVRGFYNAGQTCYMSAVLQCLLHNPFLKAFYLGGCHLSATCERDNCISCGLDEVFTDFYGVEKYEGYGIQNFLYAIWKESELMAGYKQQDAHEFFQFLLDALHSHNTDQPPSDDATVDTPASSEATSNDSSRCTCVIHQTFFGRLQSTVTCEKCKNVNTTFDPFMDLSLDLPLPGTTGKGKKRRPSAGSLASSQTEKKDDDKGDSKEKDKDKEKDGEANVVIGPVDLKDCLSRFTGKESLNPAEYTCSKCKNVGGGATKELSIRKLPPVVPIHLKRFEHALYTSSKIEGRVTFPMRLDLSPYTTHHKDAAADSSKLSIDAFSTNLVYELYGVIVHKGSGVDNGHYVAYVRAGEGREWFRFDDSKVALVSDREVLAAEAYLLFYMIRFVDS